MVLLWERKSKGMDTHIFFTKRWNIHFLLSVPNMRIIGEAKRKGVHIGMKQGNERGFTLIEVLVSFSAVLIITAVLPLLFQTIFTLTKVEDGVHPLELEVFSQQAKMEIRTAKSVTTSGKILTIKNGNGLSITYEKYQGNIRRRVNGTGHEIMLQNVGDVTFVQARNGAVFFITGDNGDFYEIPVHAIRKEWAYE